MREKITYAAAATGLVGYAALAVGRCVLLIRSGTLLGVLLGAAAGVLPLLGLWFLGQTTRFAHRAGRLAAELGTEGLPPPQDVPRLPSGRVDPAWAAASFRLRRAEVERAPDDWRCWFRLAVAYRMARDTPRARRAIQRAIALHDAGRAAGDGEL
jgi:hypothetical protein